MPRRGSHLVVALPDIHFPQHGRLAMRVVRKALKILQPRKVVFLGDGLDAERFSRHRNRCRAEFSRLGFFNGEVAPMRDLLDYLERECGVKEIVYLEGNHEFRIERWITEEGGIWEEIEDMVSPRTLLAEDRQGKFVWVPYAPGDGSIQHYRIAKGLVATHGWTCCKHASDKHLADIGQSSVIHGHTHRKQSATKRDPLTGQVYHGWSPGTLSRLQPLWRTPFPTQWVHGFSLIYCASDLSSWTAYSPTIDNGRVILPDGTRVSGR